MIASCWTEETVAWVNPGAVSSTERSFPDEEKTKRIVKAFFQAEDECPPGSKISGAKE